MTTNETTLVAEIANACADAHAFEYAGNFGRGVFAHRVKVTVSENRVSLASACDAQISQKRALEILRTVERATVDAVIALPDAPKIFGVKTRGHRVTRAGFRNMGSFCTTAFVRIIRVESGAEAAA
jgi:hypothetical protein